MAGLIHLRDLHEQHGIDYIKNLLAKEVYITEKIDGARFAVERAGDRLTYYKRNAIKPISMIDRTVMGYYENAISHFESIGVGSIPPNARIGFEYFTNTNPGSISYDIIPENGLMLTDITVEGKLVRDISELNRYANLLKVSPPPIIHNGTLSESQRDRLIEFVLSDWNNLISRFKNESFTEYVVSIFNPTLESTALNNDISKPIEGFVFSFVEGDEHINAKIVDPTFTERVRTESKERNTNISELNNRISGVLRHMIGFVKENAFHHIKPKSNISELVYVEILSEIFHSYYKQHPHMFEGIPHEQPPIQELDINYNHIFNPELKSVLENDARAKFVYKKYLPSFESKRTRGNHILKKDMVEDLNMIIPQLKRLASRNSDVMMENVLNRIINILSES